MVFDKKIRPKALETNELAQFFDISIKLRKLDLEFFSKVLKLVEASISNTELLSFIKEEIADNAENYMKINEMTDIAYRKTGLAYNASENPVVV